MISMQYRFVLPADYDMGIIRERIRDKGHLLDDFPDLAFKAYLLADRQSAEHPAPLNLYAPFYLWRSTEGMKRFLCCPGFDGLQNTFGRPQVMSGIPLAQHLLPNFRQARYASRVVQSIAPLASLEALEASERQQVEERSDDPNLLACLSALDPYNWTLTRFALYAEPVEDGGGAETESYQVGYMAGPSG